VGTYVLSHGYYDALLYPAMKVRRLIASDFARAFTQCDLIAVPSPPASPSALVKSGRSASDYLADLYTVPGSLAGFRP